MAARKHNVFLALRAQNMVEAGRWQALQVPLRYLQGLPDADKGLVHIRQALQLPQRYWQGLPDADSPTRAGLTGTEL